jgi:putative thioredoxin
MSDWVQDVNEDSFEREVVERSRTLPVVIDFWAPWCGPCRLLGPLLERLAEEHQGAFALAKVNVDENPRLAAAFGAHSIPLVVAVRDGRVIADFVGALPEEQVRAFLSRVMPSEAERIAGEAEAKAGAGSLSEAEALFRRALEQDPRCEQALFGLAKLLAGQRRDDEALALLERVLPGSPVEAQADRLAAEIRIRQAGGGDPAALRAKVTNDPDDLDARFALAGLEAAAGAYERALEQYLEIVRRDRAFRDEGARKAMLNIFDLLGPGNELAERYRSELAKVLFS